MPSYTLIIGNKNYSSWSWRAWLALKQTGASFEEVVVPLDTPQTAVAIAKYSPAGRVPVLRHGERVIWDSLAIAEYLAEQHPKAGLWPEDIDARAYARCVVAEMHSGFAALRSNCTMNLRLNAPGKGLDAPGVAQDVARLRDIWTEGRKRFGGTGEFLCGRYSVADAFFTPVVGRCMTYAILLSGAAKTYADAVWTHPFTKAWRDAAAQESMTMPRYEPHPTKP
ncbi:MAG: glutathione S-transferase family protein [Myxococcaceae bacterium]